MNVPIGTFNANNMYMLFLVTYATQNKPYESIDNTNSGFMILWTLFSICWFQHPCLL